MLSKSITLLIALAAAYGVVLFEEFFGANANPAPNPSPISNTEQIFSNNVIENVQRTWNCINSDLQFVGNEMLISLFTKYPLYQSYFLFKDIPLGELKEDKSFQKHSLDMTSGLNTTIENLNNPDVLVAALTGNGKRHAGRKVTTEMFENAGEVILETVLAVLGDQKTEDVASAWTEVIRTTVSVAAKEAAWFKKLIWLLFHPLFVIYWITLASIVSTFSEFTVYEILTKSINGFLHLIALNVTDAIIYSTWTFIIINVVLVPTWLAFWSLLNAPFGDTTVKKPKAKSKSKQEYTTF